LLDEIQQWRNGRPLYDIIVDGISAREQPMISITSTAGTVREDIYDEIYEECENIIAGYDQVDGYKDERTLPLIYELDKIEEMYDEKMWIKANPNLGVSKSVDYLRDKVNRAKNNPVIAKNVLCKEFNIRQTSNESWLRFEQLNNEQKFDINELKPRYCIGGLDLSNTTDLTCATVIFKIPNDDNLYVEQMYWLPEELLEERVKYDKTPYDKWHLNGYLRLSEGNKINYKDVVKWFVEIQEKYDLYMYKIGFDSWNSQYIVDELKDNFGEHSLEKIVQGPKTFSSPMKVFAADLSAKKIIYNNNPMLKWCLANSAIEVDRNDNIALIKTSKSTRRIDGVASLLDAYICLINNQDDYLNLI